MNKNIDKQIADARLVCEKANKELQRLLDLKSELPYIEKKAKTLILCGYSDAYVQSVLYSHRTPNIGINEIVEVMNEIKSNLTADEKKKLSITA